MSVSKKICSVFMALLMLVSVAFSVPATSVFAAGTPTLSAENKTVDAGSEFTVNVNIKNATSVYNGNFTLQYDNSKLEVESYKYGSIFNEHTRNCNLNYQSTGNQIRFTFSGAYALTGDGTLVTFTFRAKENVSGSSLLNFTAYKIYDENGISLSPTATNGSVSISEKVSAKPELSIVGETVNAGDTISVPVKITNTESVYNGNFTLQYDSSLLTVESYTYGSIFNEHTKNCNLDYQSTGNQIRFTFSGAYALTGDGTLVTFTFRAKENVSGTSNLNFTAYKIYDENGISLSSTATNGNITVNENSSSNIITGQCGDDVYYALYINSGELIISGTGDMWDFTTFDAPWYEFYADNIKSLEIQDSVTTIGSRAFSYCYYLTDVKFGNNIKHIGSGAFSHCSSLLSIVLPSGVESIGDWAFEYCNDLSEIVLPDTITSIGKDICDVTSFHENDANWTGDVLYIGKHLVDTKFPYTGECIIKDGTLTIADCVFHQSDLTSVVIPNSVTNIGESAFSCTKLTTITIPSSVKEIKPSTFYHCLSLERVTITYGTKIIGSGTFYYCPSLTIITIPRSVTYIGESAFDLCDNLKTVIYNGSSYGSQEEWNLIEICDNNDALLKVKPQTVTKVIDSIEINNNPTKTTYYIGDTLSTSGLKLLVTYSDGTTETITSGFTISGFSSTTAGTKVVTVTYEGLTTTFNVTVNTPSISLSQTSKTMTVGDTATLTATTTPSGQSVSWTSSNSSVVSVSNGVVTAKASGTATITAKFTYNGKTYSKTCNITVNNITKTLTSISISSNPTKTTYEIGESLNTSGLKLKLNYSDGSSEIVSNGFITSGFDSSTAGTKTITVSYSGKSTTFKVMVNDSAPIEDLPLIRIESKTARVGETITINVAVENNPGFSTASVKFVYDETRLQLTGAELSSEFATGANVSYDNLPYLTFVKSNDINSDVNMVTLTFKIVDDAEPGDAYVSLEYSEGDISDSKEKDVNFNVIDGNISIVNYIPGDINDDGKVNTKDLTRLLKYINHEDVECNELALDVNGDGKVNTKDLTRLLKYINHEDVEIF